jgi:hypothetical protein
MPGLRGRDLARHRRLGGIYHRFNHSWTRMRRASRSTAAALRLFDGVASRPTALAKAEKKAATRRTADCLNAISSPIESCPRHCFS